MSSNPSDTTTYTQAEISEQLGGLSITTVKKYIKRLKDIYVWMGEAEWTTAKGRYPAKVLEYLLDYQANCGAFRLVNGELVENTDAISFQDYKAHIWKRYEYVEQIASNAPTLEVVSSEFVEEPVSLAIAKHHGNSALADNREASADALAQQTQNVKDMEIYAEQIGRQWGRRLAGIANKAKQTAFLEESTKGDQALLDSLQPD